MADFSNTGRAFSMTDKQRDMISILIVVLVLLGMAWAQDQDYRDYVKARSIVVGR